MPLTFLATVAPAGMALPVFQPFQTEGAFSGSAANIAFELFLDPEGVVLDCTALGAELSADEAERLCARVVGRDFFDGARDPQGQAVHSVILMSRIFSMRRDNRARNPFLREPDLEISVASMPGRDRRHEIGLTVLIDEQGHVRQCLRNGNEDADWSAAACTQSGGHTFTVRHGADGEPVPYVAVLRIAFVRE